MDKHVGMVPIKFLEVWERSIAVVIPKNMNCIVVPIGICVVFRILMYIFFEFFQGYAIVNFICTFVVTFIILVVILFIIDVAVLG